jgi:FixJ family two-component response regulator
LTPVLVDLSHIKVEEYRIVLYCGRKGLARVEQRSNKQRDSSAPDTAIIVVDDDFAVRSSLKFSLEVEGLAVRSYASGAELLSAEIAPCDCLVVDQKMPGISGLDLIASLRRRNVSAPAILITSYPSLSLREQAQQAHIPIVEKPLLGNALLDKIRAVLAAREHSTNRA